MFYKSKDSNDQLKTVQIKDNNKQRVSVFFIVGQHGDTVCRKLYIKYNFYDMSEKFFLSIYILAQFFSPENP